MTGELPLAAERDEEPQAEADEQRLRTENVAFTTAIAPPFPPVHGSWAAFDAQLKSYSQATFQLYVVRTTTSVRRRNLRIAELTTTSAASASVSNEDVDADASSVENGSGAASSLTPDRAMIPSSWTWYSKTLMCTHGWKTRSRGLGKRCMAMVRSTGCPVKMCVTVQRATPPAASEWQIVVTKHIRNHNHPLSKELYLFYTENRRIYDPELLALVGGGADGGDQDDGDDNGGGDDTPVAVTSATQELAPTTAHFLAEALALSGSEDPSPVVSVAVPRIPKKAFDSWDDFQRVLDQYATKTQQCFRIRSTVSVQAKNAKLTSDDAAETPDAVLFPEDKRWYSKLLICSLGWKRKSRSKLLQFQPTLADATTIDNSNACPAMIMARLQRDVFDKWRVVVSRQVVVHNHALVAEQREAPTDEAASSNPNPTTRDSLQPIEATEDNNTALGSTTTTTTTTTTSSSALTDPAIVVGNTVLTPVASVSSSERTGALSHLLHPDQQSPCAVAASPITPPTPVSLEIRVPRVQTHHESWDAFHACLDEYSAATYQSYRTRTTSSVKGRNQKLRDAHARSNGTAAASSRNEDTDEDEDAASAPPPTSGCRLIPEAFKWYSKTLTCTHGWKDRRRGAGKRCVTMSRSTACPAKICATLQYLDDDPETSSNAASRWRVVVTKHVAHHNHNLSHELYEHYKGNRRIYDPDLLTIDAPPSLLGLPQHHASLANLLYPTTFLSSSSTLEASSPSAVQPPTSAQSHQQSGTETPAALPDSAYVAGAGPTASAFINNAALMSILSMTTSTPTPSDAESDIPVVEQTELGGDDADSRTSDRDKRSSSTASNSQPAPMTASGVSYASISSLLLSSPRPFDTPRSSSSPARRNRDDDSDAAGPDSDASRSRAKRVRLSTAGNASRTPPRRALTSYSDGDRELLVEAARPSFATADQAAVVWSPTNRLEVVAMVKDDGSPMWRAPPIRRRHATWQAFTDHLAMYSSATFQIYRVRTTSSIAQRNARVAHQLQQQQEDGIAPDYSSSSAVFAPAAYEWYAKTYLCTHGWKQRRRGKGQRVSHHLRSTQCPAKICATLQRHPVSDHTWNVIVTKQVLEHNHEVSHTAFQRYSENRKVRDPELLAQAEAMWRDGQSRRKIFEFLKERSQAALLMKDIHNLVQRWQQQDLQQQQHRRESADEEIVDSN